MDAIHVADFLKAELIRFYWVLKLGREETASQAAVQRLQAAIDTVEPVLAHHAEREWTCLPREQGWDSLQLVSYGIMVTEELKRIGRRKRPS